MYSVHASVVKPRVVEIEEEIPTGLITDGKSLLHTLAKAARMFSYSTYVPYNGRLSRGG